MCKWLFVACADDVEVESAGEALDGPGVEDDSVEDVGLTEVDSISGGELEDGTMRPADTTPLEEEAGGNTGLEGTKETGLVESEGRVGSVDVAELEVNDTAVLIVGVSVGVGVGIGVGEVEEPAELDTADCVYSR